MHDNLAHPASPLSLAIGIALSGLASQAIRTGFSGHSGD